MTHPKTIRFKFAADKALAAIHWMVREQPDIDMHTLLKSCYFADKDLLNRENRPIFGATYRAMRFGPVPLEIYEMAKGEAIWLGELGIDKYPWRLEGYRLRPESNAAPDMDVLSANDFTALQGGFVKSRAMTFTARTAATHAQDWQAANLGLMRYEDMLDDSAEKASRIADLIEAAPFMRL